MVADTHFLVCLWSFIVFRVHFIRLKYALSMQQVCNHDISSQVHLRGPHHHPPLLRRHDWFSNPDNPDATKSFPSEAIWGWNVAISSNMGVKYSNFPAPLRRGSKYRRILKQNNQVPGENSDHCRDEIGFEVESLENFTTSLAPNKMIMLDHRPKVAVNLDFLFLWKICKLTVTKANKYWLTR